MKVFLIVLLLGVPLWAQAQSDLNCDLAMENDEIVTSQSIRLTHRAWEFGSVYEAKIETDKAYVAIKLENGVDIYHDEAPFQTLTMNLTPKDPDWRGQGLGAENAVIPLADKNIRFEVVAMSKLSNGKQIRYQANCPTP